MSTQKVSEISVEPDLTVEVISDRTSESASSNLTENLTPTSSDSEVPSSETNPPKSTQDDDEVSRDLDVNEHTDNDVENDNDNENEIDQGDNNNENEIDQGDNNNDNELDQGDNEPDLKDQIQNSVFLIQVDGKIQGFTTKYETAHSIAKGISYILRDHTPAYRTFISEETGKITVLGIHRCLGLISHESVLHTITIQEVSRLM